MGKLILTILILLGIIGLACIFCFVLNLVTWLIGSMATLIIILLATGVFIYQVVLPEMKADTEEI
jgi:hypothetical protein